jgi:hypothetical protein
VPAPTITPERKRDSRAVAQDAARAGSPAAAQAAEQSVAGYEIRCRSRFSMRSADFLSTNLSHKKKMFLFLDEPCGMLSGQNRPSLYWVSRRLQKHLGGYMAHELGVVEIRSFLDAAKTSHSL